MSTTGLYDQRFIADAAIGTAEIIDGALSADAAGRAKVATGFFNEATVDDKFAAGAIDTDRLKEGADFFKRDGSVTATGAFNLGGFKITNVGDPTASGDVSTKNYVDQQVTAGKAWREPILVSEQLLDGASGGVLQAILANVAGQPSDGDTFIITDGTTTETFTFRTVEDEAFEVLIGASASDTQTNLAQAINDDSTLWSAVESSSLDEYFAANPATQLVIYRTAVSTADDRVHGTLTTQSNIKVVEFGTGEQDYRKASGTESNLPAADPAAKRFGFGRANASLASAETHLTVDNNETFTWADDTNVWQQSDVGALAAGAGLTRTNNTIDVGDVNKGVQVNADDVQVDASEIAGNGLAQRAGAGNEHLLDVDPAQLVLGGNAEVDGDTLDIDFTPVNYTPDTTPAEVTNVDHLSAHLKGIDDKFGTLASATTARQESVTAENISGTDTALTDTLNNTPESAASVVLFLNGAQMRQGFHYSISGQTITWNANSSGFDLLASDNLVAYYRSTD